MGLKETPEPQKETPARKGALRRYAEKAFATIAVIATMQGAMEGEARAQETKGSDTAGEKMNLREGFEKKISGGNARYAQGVERIEEQGWRGNATVTRVEVVDEGDPGVQGDELILTERLFRYDGDDGKREWIRRTQEPKGDWTGKDREFGVVDATTKSMFDYMAKYRRGDSHLRMELNSKLRGYTAELKVIRAFREIDKGNTPEAKYLLGELQEKVRAFQNHFPDVPLDQKSLVEVFGSSGN